MQSAVTSNPHPHSHTSHSDAQTNVNAPSDEFAALYMFLQAHFGDVSQPQTQLVDGDEDELLVIDVSVDGIVARVDLISMVTLFWFRRVALVDDCSGWNASRMSCGGGSSW